MTTTDTNRIPIQGMDCIDCTRRVERAIGQVPGVQSVDVSLGAEMAIIQSRGAALDLDAIRNAVKQAGYSVPEQALPPEEPPSQIKSLQNITGPVLSLFGLVFGAVLFVVVVGEWMGVFEAVSKRVPWPLALAVILAGGYPVFRNVIAAARQRQVIAHTLMTLGVVAACAVGEWATAAVVVFFMRVGDYTEKFTTERARDAVKALTELAPKTARLEQDGLEAVVPIEAVQIGDVVVVRPGEHIPVDGEVLSGNAAVDQASITGEALPVEAGPGGQVFAASLARLGSLRVRVTAVGADTTFGQVIRLVQEAETHRAQVQRMADRFSTYLLPLVAGIAALTFLFRRDALATAAVLVVACSCSFALATPIAMLASIGAAARHGLLVKGGLYLEALARADVLLIDKTGTLTLGQPHLTDIVTLNNVSEAELLALAASAERYSEHPLAEAVRQAARDRDIPLANPQAFQAVPGMGVQAKVGGHTIAIGRQAQVEGATRSRLEAFQAQGKATMTVTRDGELIGVLAAADTIRPEVPEALAAVRAFGLTRIELLTGDSQPAAEALAAKLGIPYRAGLLPEEKIAIVRTYQAAGHRVVMVGDGINDAPALAQADVGIAMGAAGSDAALEAAHIALLRDDWRLVPKALHIARRTMRVVRGNLIFTTVYNLAGLTLAALGFLPPVLAAAAQSLPDLGILGNSSRLLKS